MLDGWLQRSYRRRLLDRDLGSVLPWIRGEVLEVGAGRARRRGAFRPSHMATRWICADIASDARPDLVADARRMAVRSDRFDVVVCLEVLEYLPGTSGSAEALSEFRRVLRRDGRLILSMPFLHRMDALDDRWRSTMVGLEDLLDAAGFEIVWRSAQGAALATVANILKFAVWKTFRHAVFRTLAALIALPVLEVLIRLDAPAARRSPELASFATGYLVVAQRR